MTVQAKKPPYANKAKTPSDINDADSDDDSYYKPVAFEVALIAG